ncbi:CRISPR-associated protein Cas4 [Heliophilum fasciatum]|nr:CRISPR-associated protein Cas4 [Heliophilum fasciatum]MCW2279016.1 CRISPR-associated exonuclease Cas4 [Heliophilum fasciatum]
MMLKVTDIKQYVYCPRIPYFTYVLPVAKKMTRKMAYGRESHDRLDELEKRRTFAAYRVPGQREHDAQRSLRREEKPRGDVFPEWKQGERFFHTYLCSMRLGLEGKLDEHLVHGKDIFPVEFKATSRGPGLNHKYQLTAYAMLLEEHYQRSVRRGYFKLVSPFRDEPGTKGRERTIPVEITEAMRDHVKGILGKIRAMIWAESLPEVPRRGKQCLDCEYRRYCGDVV